MPLSSQDTQNNATPSEQTTAGELATPAAADVDRVGERPTGWRYVLRRLRKDKSAVFGAVIVALTTLIAVFAPLITKVVGVDPYTYDLDALDGSGLPLGSFGGISAAHPFGVEPQTGRDLFAVVIEGTRTSFSIGMGATVLSMVIAIALGLSAGYFGGWWDVLVSRLTDVTLGFPHLVFMIAISAIIPATAPRVLVMILIIGILGWPSTARVLRSRTLALRGRTFVGASRAMGASQGHVLITQVLPNLVATIIVFTTIAIPGKITAEAALSFLGVGVAPPTPSWGRSIGNAVTWVSTDPWYLLFPGAALFLVTLAFNLFGDGLRDALDPRTGENR
ncbi:ABC transporter, permease protein [Actinomyces urogenitalis DSM 15434]|uniref:ABC transporter, permease protein n=1 Tax=Actinomyces urogenitalis DSM 15434 TaxID=525246 RepID=C0W4A4_9ACTO|nr:ABC transporter permease [Actinomyces urogenitalis]EEH66453.1 ABC transporter, permease protein [Actinomyces urogenitalis DSM 15434]MDK8836152.1 ABC transporter permease [Actinomyces urogenitalis]